jgi:hypothetical protein
VGGAVSPIGVPKYSTEQLDMLLLKIVEWRGSPAKAHLELLDEGWEISKDSLQQLKFKYSERYAELEEIYAREVEGEIIAQARENARLAGEATREAITATMKALEDGKIEGVDLARTAQALSRTMGTNIDRVLSMTGRPINPTDKSAKDALSIVRDLVGSGVIKVRNEATDAPAEVEGVSDAIEPGPDE